MSKKRITGRFYVFVLVIAVIAFLLVRSVLPMGVSEAVIMLATATDQQYLDAVIVRDETVVSYAGVTRIAYVAAEGSLVEEGDEIAYIDSSGIQEIGTHEELMARDGAYARLYRVQYEGGFCSPEFASGFSGDIRV